MGRNSQSEGGESIEERAIQMKKRFLAEKREKFMKAVIYPRDTDYKQTLRKSLGLREYPLD